MGLVSINITRLKEGTCVSQHQIPRSCMIRLENFIPYVVWKSLTLGGRTYFEDFRLYVEMFLRLQILT